MKRMTFCLALVASTQLFPLTQTVWAGETQTVLQEQAAKNIETGKYYRFKGSTGKYVSSKEQSKNGANVRLKMTDNTADAIFYYAPDKTLTGLTFAAINGYTMSNSTSEITFEDAGEGKYFIVTKFADKGEQLGGWYATTNNVDRWMGAYNTKNECKWTIEEVSSEEANAFKLTKDLSAAGYATLVAPVDLSYTGDATAYIATGKTADNNAVVLKPIEKGMIPAGTAVIIKGTASTDFTIASLSETEISTEENLLKGFYTNTNIPDNDLSRAYILAKDGETAKFFKVKSDDKTLGANKAYLLLPEESASQTLRVEVYGETTGIEDSVSDSVEDEKDHIYYDLTGARVMNPKKGNIYVTASGKKILFIK